MHKVLIAGESNVDVMDETASREEDMSITSSDSLGIVLDALNKKQDVFIVHDFFYNKHKAEINSILNNDPLIRVFIFIDHDPIKPFERIPELLFKAYYLKKHKLDKDFFHTLLSFVIDFDETYRYKDVTIDYNLKQVKVKNNILVLTPMEYELFLYMMSHQGITQSRDELIKAVWGYSFLGDSRTIDTHIKSLRRKLGSYRCLIKTVWGKGYKYQES